MNIILNVYTQLNIICNTNFNTNNKLINVSDGPLTRSCIFHLSHNDKKTVEKGPIFIYRFKSAFFSKI